MNMGGFMYLVNVDMVRHVLNCHSPDCMQAKGGVCMCG